jgi:hypothetical protein
MRLNYQFVIDIFIVKLESNCICNHVLLALIYYVVEVNAVDFFVFAFEYEHVIFEFLEKNPS